MRPTSGVLPRCAPSAVLLALIMVTAVPCLRAASQHKSKPEQIEWTWEVRPAHANAKLPNVLLEGDSLSRNYFPEVERRLRGKANVYLLACSISVGDPRLPKEIATFGKMEGVRFRIVHFNNGMHGWTYTEAQYEAGFPAYLAALRSIAPGAVFIWTMITPIKTDSPPGPTNARIDARNVIAHKFVRGMSVDDQHALMEKHKDLYGDNVHFNQQGSDIMGAQAAKTILQALGNKLP